MLTITELQRRLQTLLDRGLDGETQLVLLPARAVQDRISLVAKTDDPGFYSLYEFHAPRVADGK